MYRSRPTWGSSVGMVFSSRLQPGNKHEKFTKETLVNVNESLAGWDFTTTGYRTASVLPLHAVLVPVPRGQVIYSGSWRRMISSSGERGLSELVTPSRTSIAPGVSKIYLIRPRPSSSRSATLRCRQTPTSRRSRIARSRSDDRRPVQSLSIPG
jgi:hypothetical protein